MSQMADTSQLQLNVTLYYLKQISNCYKLSHHDDMDTLPNYGFDTSAITLYVDAWMLNGRVRGYTAPTICRLCPYCG